MSIRLLKDGTIQAYTPHRTHGWAWRDYPQKDIVQFLQYSIVHCRWTLRDFIKALDTRVGRKVFSMEGVTDYLWLQNEDFKKSNALFLELARFYDETDYSKIGFGGKEHDIAYCASLIGNKAEEDQVISDVVTHNKGERTSWSASYTPLAEMFDLPLVINPTIKFQGSDLSDKRTFKRKFTVLEVYQCVFDDIGFCWRDE